MSINSVGIFCAASESIASEYATQAQEVGTLIGRMRLTMVYGGAAAGLMEQTAQAARNAGAHIIGVVPKILEQRNRVSCLLDERVVTENLSDRKDNILSRSDLLVALPGGIGTLDEIFHVLAAATIGYHCKPVVLYATDGFWDDVIAMIRRLKQNGFVRCNVEELLLVARNIYELENILKER